ncbi:unnamed protein product [Lepidochelys kempii]
MDSPAALLEKIDAALEVYASAAAFEENPSPATETSSAALCTTAAVAPQKAPQAATTKKTLGASRTLQTSSTKRKAGDCPKDPLRDAVPDRSRTQRPACRDITARRNIPAAPQQRQPPRASPPALQQLLTKSPPALQQHQLPLKSPPTPPLQEAPRASPPALQQLLTKSPPALQQHQPPPESPPTPPLQEAPRQPPPTPAAAQVVEGGPTPLHTSKRGISADGTSTSPETTQRVTSILPDACPASETTQRVSRPLPDAPPAGPLDPTRPRRDEPASDTAGATGTPPLQGNEDTVYLQYPLAADALICPICFPPRSFHLLGGVTRHLKRCHNKQVAFSCALCSLPFETQKQCKAHQVTCRKRSKGTARPPAPAPSPAAVRRPTTPEPQQRTAMVQAAVKKAAPVARPAQQGAAIEKVPAAAGNATQVLGSRRPVSPSHVARQISILRRLSTTSPPAQHVPVPRRISAPSRIAARDPVAGRARATPQAALRTPTAGGARAAPQSALQTPAAEGASAQPQAAQQAPRTTGETNPAATENHRALLTRQPSTTPESILRDAANSGSHVPAAAAQAPATPRRTSNVPAIPEPDRVPPTTSNASIPPEIPPQPPTEGNDGSRDGRRVDCAGDESASDKVEDHEGQQPVERAATPWQTAWTAELRATASFDDFDLLVDRLTQELSAETAPRRRPTQENAPPAHRPPAPNPNTTARGTRRRGANCRYDPAAASRIQKLYRANRPKAMREILDGPSPYCTIPPERLYSYFKDVFDHTAQDGALRPECLRPLPRVDEAGALEADFTPKEVLARLSKTKNTAPGKDGIRYSLLKKRDPGCLVLATLFNQCKRFCRTPSSWKKAMTVLVYKKGERDDPSNWRPISLCSTMYKLYASCLASRITEWSVRGGAISSTQKGFMSCEGCYEHNFVLQTIIDTTRRARRQGTIAWLDLANAFGSMPHHHIFATLQEFGMPENFRRAIREMYEGCSTTIRSVEGETAEIPIRCGVKQGCPLSPIIFNLAMEPLLRAISKGAGGFNLHGERVSVLAYADDLVLTADDPENLQRMLDATSRVADWMGLRFNAKKCASLHIDGSKRDSVQGTEFQIQGEPVIPLAEGQAYRHLGTPTGFRVRQTPEDTIQEILQDTAKIDTSLLAPWQKINALNTFLIPRISFVLRGSAVAKVPLNKADKVIRQLVKKWLFLPQRASNELVYITHRHGGANVPRMGDLGDIAVITHAFRLLTCPDATVKSIAAKALHDVTQKRIGRAPSSQDTASFLSGSLDGEFGRDGGDIASLWSRARNATRRLGKRIGCRWEWCEERQELGVLVPQIGSEGNTIVTPSARGLLERTLKAATHSLYVEALKRKPDQGKAFELTSKWDASNHFLAGGGFTRFADWRFIHRARLNCVPLNGAVRHGNRDKRCRKCGYSNETLPHVLCSCKPHSRAWQLRHNAIQNRLVKAISPSLGEVAVNCAISGTDSPLRPDVVVTNETQKKIILVDITVPFENRTPAFREARARKLEKYAPLADTLRAKGYEVQLDALIVGALGAWDPCNERVLRTCGIGRRYARLMRRLMVSDTIRWSRDIYIEHITGHRQYQEE